MSSWRQQQTILIHSFFNNENIVLYSIIIKIIIIFTHRITLYNTYYYIIYYNFIILKHHHLYIICCSCTTLSTTSYHIGIEPKSLHSISTARIATTVTRSKINKPDWFTTSSQQHHIPNQTNELLHNVFVRGSIAASARR